MSHNKEAWKKFILLVLCLGLTMGTVSATGEPAADAAAEITETMTEAAAETGGVLPEALSDDAAGAEQVHAETGALTPAISDRQAAAGFISQLMTGRELTPPKPRGTLSGAQLTGREAKMYAALKTKIQQVAAGKLSNTNFKIPVRDVFENRAYSSVSEMQKLDFDLVTRALLYDLPYDLYWFDKTTGNIWGGLTYQEKNGKIYLYDYEHATMDVSYYVSADYSKTRQPGTLVYDTSFSTRAVTAAANARNVVQSNAGKSDLHKLQAYKNYICAQVDYDHAAPNGAYYGDPWQLVNVFDGNASTKVVCEGYSKAFQFLCDESAFRGKVSVASVTGGMSGGTGEGGRHMWNVVRMPDGRHYLADITNSDSTAVGHQGDLFLKGYFSCLPSQNQYNYWVGNSTMISYVYDSMTLQMLNATGMLAVSVTDYTPTAADYVDSGPALILPGHLTKIRSEALAGTKARQIVVPASCTSVEARAFADCDSLEEVILMGTNTNLAVSAFEGCNKVITLWIHQGNPAATIFQNNSRVKIAYLDN